MIRKTACIGIALFALHLNSIAISIDPSTMRIVASKQEVLTKLGGVTKAKLVFLIDHRLYFIDYAETNPQIRLMANVPGAAAPDISPDGRYVTYDNNIAIDDYDRNRVGPTSAYVCEISPTASPILVCADSGNNPRFIKDSVNTLAIIYCTRGAPASGKIYDYESGRTVKKTFNGTTVGPEQIVWAGGSYRSGLSRGSRYLGHAEQIPNTYILDLQNGGGVPVKCHRDKYRYNNADSTINISGQTCNGSISTSYQFPNCIMNLDFGSNIPAGFTNSWLGASWISHEYAFISNTSGRVVRKIGPSPFKKMNKVSPPVAIIYVRKCTVERPEWTNNPYWVVFAQMVDRLAGVSGAWTDATKSENVILHNLKDSSYINLVETTDSTSNLTGFEFPTFWTELPANFAATEDTNYLKPPELRPSGVIRGLAPRQTGSAQIAMKNSLITSKDPLASVGIYQLTGVQVRTVALKGASPRTCEITGDMFPARGTYFIRASTVTGERATFRLTTAR